MAIARPLALPYHRVSKVCSMRPGRINQIHWNLVLERSEAYAEGGGPVDNVVTPKKIEYRSTIEG